MDTGLVTTIVSTSGAVVVAIAGLAANTFWMRDSIKNLREDVREIRTTLQMIMDKLSAMDVEIARLMDKRP
jgi:hypothetical protein